MRKTGNEINKTATLFAVVAAVLSTTIAFGDADGTWTKRAGVGTGGTDWTSWNEPLNWVGGTVASGSTNVAELAAADGQYIEIPEALSLKHNTMASTPEVWPVLRSDSRVTFCPTKSATGPERLYLYAPFAFSVNESNYGGPRRFQMCGPCESVTGTPLWFYTNCFRFDLYATAAGGVRSMAWPTPVSGANEIRCWGSSVLKFYAPHGSSEAVTGNWQLTEGSRFLKRAEGQPEHVLSVGTTVTGTGIPEDTWLKRVFPDGTIELSAAATATAASVALTFASLDVDMSATVPKLTTFAAGGETQLCVQKYRAEDAFTVNFGLLDGGAKSPSATYFAQYKITTENGFTPGVAALSGVSKNQNSNVKVTLENCHLKIVGDKFGDANFLVPDAAHTARVTVVTGESHFMGPLNSLAGTLIKDGEGTLTVNVTNAASAYTGTLSIEAGTLAITNANAYVATLSIAAGATLDVPAGIHVGTLSAAPGAKIRGGQILTDTAMEETMLRNVVLLDGSYIVDNTPTSNKPLTLTLVSGACTTQRCGDDDAVTTFSTNSLIRVEGCGYVDLLLVGGGGGGGSMWGGGGGGVVYRQQVFLTNGWYGVAVGLGGKGAPSKFVLNTSGGDSSFVGVTAYGGGAAGTYHSATDENGNQRNGTNKGMIGIAGGSGGGGGTMYYAYGENRSAAGGAGIAGQGHAGGKSVNWAQQTPTKTYIVCGAGGGGAGASGQNAVTNSLTSLSGACGGAGVTNWITGAAVVYGGGGGGAGNKTAVAGSGLGGEGGGGNGHFGTTATAGGNGTDGLGGGGGGGCANNMDSDPGTAGRGGNGGRGVVILRYARIKKGISVSFK